MSRKKIVAGNWKMHKTLQEAEALVKAVVSSAEDDTDVTKIIFPPSLFITELSRLTGTTQSFHVGAQNCYQEEQGAFTGEISAPEIASSGATHVIVGHSERRKYF